MTSSVAMRKLGRLGAVILGALLVAGSPGVAQNYRQIQIPKDRLTEFVRGLRPIARSEFDRLTQHSDELKPAVFASAIYEATLEDDVLRGVGRLQDRADNERKVLPLASNLAITSARWRDEDRVQQAALGQTPHGAAVLAESTLGELEIHWNCRATPSAFNDNSDIHSQHQFEIKFPYAFVQELRLTAPADYRVQAKDALVRNLGTRATGEVLWSIRWSGRQALHLSARASPENVTAELRCNYEVRPRGIHLSTEIALRGETERGVLALEKDANLTIVSATFGDTPLAFRPDDSNEQNVFVELPNQSDDKEMIITVTALARTQLAQLVQLPRIRPQCEWIGETSTLRIARPLWVVDLRMDYCDCTSLQPQADDEAEAYQFRFHSESGHIKLQLTDRPDDFFWEALSRILMRENSIEATVEFWIRPRYDELMDLRFAIAPDWNIVDDSIEVLENVDDFPESAKFESTRLETRILELSLESAATRTRPILVRFQVVKNGVLGNETTPAAELAPVRVLGATDQPTWIHIRDTPGLELVTGGDQYAQWQVARSDQQIPDWILATLDLQEGGPSSEKDMFLRFTADAELVTLAGTVVEALPEVNSRTKVTFRGDTLQYALDVHVDPQGKEIDNLVIEFSHPTNGEVWSLSGRAETPTVEKTHENNTEQHIVRFHPTSESFDLQFEFQTTTEIEQSIPIPLAAFRKTVGGKGIVGLLVDAAVNLDIPVVPGIEAVPFSAMGENSERQRRYQGVYRYDDTLSAPPLLNVRQSRKPSETMAWIWRTDIRSFYSDLGRPQHRADFFIQSEGATELRLRFPDTYTLKSVEVDGIPLDAESQRTRRDQDTTLISELVVPLSSEVRYPSVSVRYMEAERPLRAIDWLAPPVLQTSLQTMQETWQIWLPRGFRIYEGDQPGSPNGSWMKRLVGILGSVETADVERSLTAWLRRRWIADLDHTSTLVRRTQILLGAKFLENSAASRTWSTRLNRIFQTIRQSQPGFALFVDRAELRRLSIFPDTQLPPLPPHATKSSPLQSGTHRLSQSGMALVVDGDTMVVTSSAAAKLHAGQSDWIDQVSLDGSLSWFRTTQLSTVDSWNTEEFERLWRLSPRGLETGVQQAGWDPTQLDITAHHRLLKIYHSDTIMAWCSIVVCFGLALGWRLIERRPRILIVVGSVAFALALLLPQPGSALICTLGWSLVASSVIRVSTRTRRRRRRALPVVGRSLAPTRAAVGFVILCCAWQFIENRGNGQDVSPTDEGSIQRGANFVYVPVGDDRMPTGTVYLADPFYYELQQRHRTKLRMPDYMLTNAKYSGSLGPQGDSVAITVKYDVLALADNVVFPLPDGSDTNQIQTSTLRVNQALAKLESSGSTQWITLERAGDYRISFVVTCQWTRTLGDRRLHLTIPQSPIATLEFKVPRGLAPVKVPSAKGEVTSERGLLLANLGPTSELNMVAPETQTVLEDEWPRVTRLIKLFAGQTQTLMEVDFEFIDGDPIPLQLESDEPLGNAQTLVSLWDPLLDNRIRLQLPPYAGRFAIPEVKPINARLDATRVIVSSDGHKEVRLDDSSILTTVLPEDLESGQPADIRFEVTGELPAIEISNGTTLENWHSELSYFFEHRSTRVEVQAQLIPEYADSRMITVRRLRVPASFEINRLTATTSNGIPQRLRWHRNGDEIAIFFLDQLMASASESVEVSLEGKLGTGAEASVYLPIVELINPIGTAAKAHHVLKLYRAADVDVIVEPESLGPYLQESAGASSARRKGYRMHGVWARDTSGFQSSDDALVVQRRSVTRNILGSLTTRLEQSGEWFAKIEASLKCEEGMEAIYLDVPASLCETQPAAYTDRSEQQPLRCEVIRGGPTQGRAILQVWLPDDPEPHEQTVYVSTKLSFEQTSLPRIRLVNAELSRVEGLTQYFVELPRRGQDIDYEVAYVWKQSGLTPVPSSDNRFFRFRVSQRNYEAVLEEQQSGLEPEVMLLATQYRWQRTGNFVAISEFQLKPARETQLFVQLPQRAEVTQVFIDGHPVAFQSSPPVKALPCYRFAVTSSPWPQRIEVFYQGAVGSLGSRLRLQAPRMLFEHSLGNKQPVPIRDTLWHVEAPKGSGRPVTSSPEGTSVDRAFIDQTTIKAFVELWTRAQTSIRERPRKERIGCLASWARHLHGAISRQQLTDPDDPAWQALENIIVQYAEVFTVLPDPDALATEDLWDESRWSTENRTSFRSRPAESDILPSIGLVYPHASDREVWVRYSLSALFLCLGGALCMGNRWMALAPMIGDHPHIVLALTGLTWRLFLSPPWVGTVMMVLVAVVWVLRLIHGLRRRSLALLQAS